MNKLKVSLLIIWAVLIAVIAYSAEWGRNSWTHWQGFGLDATYYAEAANNTIHDHNNDVGCAAWIQLESGASTEEQIYSKFGSGTGYQFRISGGVIQLRIGDGPDTYLIDGNTDLRDGLKHHVVAIIDRSNVANCKVFLDGYEDGTTQKTGTLADVGDISNSSILFLGSRSGGSAITAGKIYEALISYPADIMAANEMGAAGEIANLYENRGDPSQWPNSEDYWLCRDNNASTAVLGANNNLTASANTNVFSLLGWLTR